MIYILNRYFLTNLYDVTRTAYLHTTAGFVFDGYAAGSIPEFLVHWFHALNMGVVLFAMGGYGAYLGWEVR